MTLARRRVCVRPRARSAFRTFRPLGPVAFLAALLVAGPIAAKPKVETDDEKTVYFIGVLTARQLNMLNLSDEEIDIVVRGIKDASTGDAIEIDPEEFGPKLRVFQQERAKMTLDVETKKSAEYLAEQRKASGAQVTDSGLIYTETKTGGGTQAEISSTVRVAYEGRLRDGTVFDAGTAEFPLEGVIPCWGEGVSKMKVGGKAKLVCPAAIAYGDRGMPPVIPPGAALTFDVELLEITSGQAE